MNSYRARIREYLPSGRVLAGVAAVALAMVIFVQRQTLIDWALLSGQESEQTQGQALIGQRLDAALAVSVDDGMAPVGLAEALASGSDQAGFDRRGALLMVYSQSCSACRAAVDHYLALTLTAAKPVPPLYLLSFKDTDAFPAGFPAHRLLRARFARQPSWFAGSFYPTFWYFDPAGVLSGQSLGFMPEVIDAWLLGAGELGSKPTELESTGAGLAIQE